MDGALSRANVRTTQPGDGLSHTNTQTNIQTNKRTFLTDPAPRETKILLVTLPTPLGGGGRG